ncbi:nitrite/sulfite reductase [Candidatus Albibeggiatoa sp. nov. NOAA]|uniref:nitrite/sulfite reductase n=1 Tax=Candidatus Albibeggiatoa sp. nov. NOAA TaxID=3162724 RepID=UPI0032F4657C|nr:nitrite/sulfite reductase [Thiotrichaceae bacterium]
MTQEHQLIRAEDLDNYRQHVHNFRNGSLDGHKFMVERLLMGVYSQRQAELCMVRTKIPGGVIQRQQLLGFAAGLEKFAKHDVVHISTRQNIQFHHVPLDKTPDLLNLLSEYGIGSREAGGNTVRNICACPLAGVCQHEHVNVQPYVQHIAKHFLHNPLTHSLPRKFKMGFSGCEADCAAASSHDLTVVARYKEGKAGFKVYLGGGLGAKPHQPIVLEEFIEPDDLLASVQAALTVHNNNSDRTRKNRSRVKFLVDRLGEDEVVNLYQVELQRTRTALKGQVPTEIWNENAPAKPQTNDWLQKPQAQRQEGYVTVPLSISHGDLTAVQLRGLAKVLEDFGLVEVRSTAQQNLLIPYVPQNQWVALYEALKSYDLHIPTAGQRVTACPGTATCQLGITASAQVAKLLSGGSKDLRIHVNGCQNSCAHSDTADIGLYGKGRRHQNKLVPSYILQLGGSSDQFGMEGPKIPSRRAPQAVQRIHDTFAEQQQVNETFQQWVLRQEKGYFDELLADLIEVKLEDLEELRLDHGDDRVFKVNPITVSECAAGQASPLEQLWLQVDYEITLRDAFAAKNKYDEVAESIQNALQFAEQALADVELEPAVQQHTQALKTSLNAWQQQHDELAYPQIKDSVDSWLLLVRGVSMQQLFKQAA